MAQRPWPPPPDPPAIPTGSDLPVGSSACAGPAPPENGAARKQDRRRLPMTLPATRSLTALALAATALGLCLPAAAADPEACAQVRFSDVGWTDITATTALTSQVLRGL